jgi:hypothetical protein
VNFNHIPKYEILGCDSRHRPAHGDHTRATLRRIERYGTARPFLAMGWARCQGPLWPFSPPSVAGHHCDRTTSEMRGSLPQD